MKSCSGWICSWDDNTNLFDNNINLHHHFDLSSWAESIQGVPKPLKTNLMTILCFLTFSLSSNRHSLSNTLPSLFGLCSGCFGADIQNCALTHGKLTLPVSYNLIPRTFFLIFPYFFFWMERLNYTFHCSGLLFGSTFWDNS